MTQGETGGMRRSSQELKPQGLVGSPKDLAFYLKWSGAQWRELCREQGNLIYSEKIYAGCSAKAMLLRRRDVGRQLLGCVEQK